MKKHKQTHNDLGLVVHRTLMWSMVPFIPKKSWGYLRGQVVGDLSRKAAKCLLFQLEER